jgi:hypothetical protein
MERIIMSVGSICRSIWTNFLSVTRTVTRRATAARANRLLEPWFHIRIILSGTEFENFFALRAHKAAHPDFQKLAFKMLELYNASQPMSVADGDWHIPFMHKFDKARLDVLYENHRDLIDNNSMYEAKIAIARCARISYLNYEGKDDYEADIRLCDRLFGGSPKHLSPAEHVARARQDSDWCGNFRGWTQYRKLFKDENLTDERVTKR